MKAIPQMLDIGDPEAVVVVELRADSKVLWVTVDGVTVLRVQNISEIYFQGPRKESDG